MVKSICWHSGRLRRILYVRRPVMRWQIYRTETSQPALVTRLLKQHTDQNKMTSGDGWHIWWSSSSHWSSWSASFLVAPHPYCQEPNNKLLTSDYSDYPDYSPWWIFILECSGHGLQLQNIFHHHFHHHYHHGNHCYFLFIANCTKTHLMNNHQPFVSGI